MTQEYALGFSIGWVPWDDDPNGAFSFVSSFCWFIVFSCCCGRLDRLVAMNRSHSSHRLTSFICTLPLLFCRKDRSRLMGLWLDEDISRGK